MAEVSRERAHTLRQRWHCDPEQARSLGAQICDIVAMVLKIQADLGRIVDEVDSEAFQALGGADPRDHQELRRSEGAATNHDLAARVKPPLGAAETIGDADGAPSLEQNAPRLTVGKHLEIGGRRE